MNRLLIIDGHNLHFQIFFGIRARLKKKPKNVSPFGVGFTGAIKRIIRAANATHVLVIFDGEHENPRRALLPTYKANRPDYSLLPDDENPYLQLPAVYKALDNLKIKYIETTEVEADDLIAICAERYRSAAEITVCSHDHDFYQLLVGTRVRLMSYSMKHAEFYDERAFREEYHISPRRFADYKALTGDKSDNIPGVRGVGNISATRLIGQLGGIENIIERSSEIRQKKLRRCIIEGTERMRLNYKLVKLGGDPSIPAPFKLSELAYYDKSARPDEHGGDSTKAHSADRSAASSGTTGTNSGGYGTTGTSSAKPEPSAENNRFVPSVMEGGRPPKKHSRSRHKKKTEQPGSVDGSPIEAQSGQTAKESAQTSAEAEAVAVNSPDRAVQAMPSPRQTNKKHRRRRPRNGVSNNRSSDASINTERDKTVTEAASDE